MGHGRLVRAWAAALLLAPAAARAQAWDADAFAALKARLADVPAPAAPAPRDAPPADPDARARALFRRALIVGASVSSGFRAESPGRKLARRFGAADASVTVAAPGASGARMVAELTDARLASATVVVGVDLFFWDARRDCDAGLAAVDELFRRLAPRRTPVILGNVPSLSLPLLGGGGCRAKLNERIASACAADASCVLLDLDRLWAKVAADGAVLDGRRCSMRELMADGLHPNDAGSELAAREILAAIGRAKGL